MRVAISDAGRGEDILTKEVSSSTKDPMGKGSIDFDRGGMDQDGTTIMTRFPSTISRSILLTVRSELLA
jgi:hypothetical protein